MQHSTIKHAHERLNDFRIGILREEDRQIYDSNSKYSQTFPYFAGGTFVIFLTYMISKTDMSDEDP